MGLLWPSKMAPYEKPSKCPNVIGFIDDMFVQFIDVFFIFWTMGFSYNLPHAAHGAGGIPRSCIFVRISRKM
jgi:hypothetical protein